MYIHIQNKTKTIRINCYIYCNNLLLYMLKKAVKFIDVCDMHSVYDMIQAL